MQKVIMDIKRVEEGITAFVAFKEMMTEIHDSLSKICEELDSLIRTSIIEDIRKGIK